MAQVWPVRFDEALWESDLAFCSTAAREAGEVWRERLAVIHRGLPLEHALKCDPDHDDLALPRCVKTRIPDAHSADLRRSPWGAVLVGRQLDGQVHLDFLAFGLRKPEAVGSTKPSVYLISHQRLFPPG